LENKSRQIGINGWNELHKLKDIITAKLDGVAKETQSTQLDMKNAIKALHEDGSSMVGRIHLGISQADSRFLIESVKNLQERQFVTDSNQKFLESLWFGKIDARRRRIEKAHTDTFEWIFKDSEPDERVSPRFTQWLRHGTGAFWIRGKAGSGKSTLMKFICDHPTTLSHLNRWAKHKKLCVAKFFFWNSGTSLQKSRQGLLRSLLFEILRKAPDMIPYVSNGSRSTPSVKSAQYRDEEDAWSTEELTEAYLSLMERCHEIAVKFCFFIDGLDEFGEDRKTHLDLINTLRMLATSKNIKFCVSSRPWVIFSDAFGENPKLLLKVEDLTRDDIRRYVTDKFNENSQFRIMSDTSPMYSNLIEEITAQAQGVFLWVYLVVRDLLEGFSHSDTISTLHKRLRRFPADLEHFFQHMIDTIPEIYLPQTARTIWLATSVTQPQLLMVYSLLDDAADDMQLFLRQSLMVMFDTEVTSRAEQMRRRLDGRCKGLLEIVTDETSSGPFFEFKVDFLHRTVRDFLFDSPQIRKMSETHRFADLGASGWLVLCAALLAVIKRAPFRQKSTKLVRSLLEDLFHFAHEVEMNLDDHTALVRLLMDAESNYIMARSMYSWSTADNLCLVLACQANVLSFLKAKSPLYDIQDPIEEGRAPLLDYALHPLGVTEESTTAQCWSTHPRIIRHLVESGFDPNLRFDAYGDSTTPWERFIRGLYLGGLTTEDERVFETVQLLWENGADRDATITHGTFPMTVKKVIRKIFTEEQADLLLSNRLETHQVQTSQVKQNASGPTSPMSWGSWFFQRWKSP
jgi:hypothetical protein